MKIVLVFVSTLDGKVTKWDNPFVRSWSSKDDQEYFSRIWEDSPLIVMGSNTFTADPLKPSSKHLLVVMTRNPSAYEKYQVAGHLEFTDESPALLVPRFKKEGRDLIVVVGGPHVAASFLKEKLIDEVWLTVEPRIFGTGSNFVTEEKLDIELQLISCEKVNSKGTLITRYAILKYNDIS